MALDKVTSGYYSNLLNPKLARVRRAFLLAIRAGLLQADWRGPWMAVPRVWRAVAAASAEQGGLTLVETYEERPTQQVCVDRLKLP